MTQQESNFEWTPVTMRQTVESRNSSHFGGTCCIHRLAGSPTAAETQTLAHETIATVLR